MSRPGTPSDPPPPSAPDRRTVLSGLGGAAVALTAACSTTPGRTAARDRAERAPVTGRPVLVGSSNGLEGMRRHWSALADGADPLDVAIEVIKIVEADPTDHSVGLGGLPNEDGVVQLDAAVMHGPTHNAGAVAALENILHPCEVARLVMERTDHWLLAGPGAYAFAREHGHAHVELLTDEARAMWTKWRNGENSLDFRVPRQRPRGTDADRQARATPEETGSWITGTSHCSALSARGEVACATTTSGQSYKLPGRVGDSPIVGAGLYCDQEAGSAGSTGRGEAAVLSAGSASVVELLRRGASAREAGLEVLERITRQARRAARWQPGLVDERGVPTFSIQFYVLDLRGGHAGVTLRGGGKYALADAEGGARLEPLVALHA